MQHTPASQSCALLCAPCQIITHGMLQRCDTPLQVRQNFDRFISCKTTIDDIYSKLQIIEAPQAAAAGGAHSSGAVSTEVLFRALQEVCYSM